MKVAIKWGSRTFSDVEVDEKETLEQFQVKLFSLTNVPIARQKIFFKGKWIKNQELFGTMIANGVDLSINLLGSADECVVAPAKPVIFEEDLPPEAKAKLVTSILPGLFNLGNTCYMNSTLQALKAVTPLNNLVKEYVETKTSLTDGNEVLTRSLGKLYRDMDSATSSVTPTSFCLGLRKLYPQFDEKDSKGKHKQQDADECLTEILSNIKLKLNKNVEEIFGIGMVEILTCDEEDKNESDTSPRLIVSTSDVDKNKFTKTELSLTCFIDEKVNFLTDGIERSMEDTIEKRSEKLGRNAIYKQKRYIARFPPYLIIRLNRFYWKSELKVKSKICRPVLFPDKLDLLFLANSKIKPDLLFIRKVFEEKKEKELVQKNSVMETTKTSVMPLEVKYIPETKSYQPLMASLECSSISGAKDISKLRNEIKISNILENSKKTVVEVKESTMIEEMFRGYYEPLSIVTHIGRGSESGHYISWVRNEINSDEWFKFDDDVVSIVSNDYVKDLGRSGANTHIPYIIIFRRCGKVIDKC